MTIKIAVMANAGGVGKSTLVTHLAWVLGKKHKVLIIDLDPQNSMNVFCGVQKVSQENSIASLMLADEPGQLPLIPLWDTNTIYLCPGHIQMVEVTQALATRIRGEYVLADILEDVTGFDVILIDCPATLGMLATNAIAACTHIIIPLQMEMKAVTGFADLVSWNLKTIKQLRLKPAPEMLGIIPSMYDKNIALHRQCMEQMPAIAQKLGIELYPAIRASAEFKNASVEGLPLHCYRPGHAAIKDFELLAKDIQELLK